MNSRSLWFLKWIGWLSLLLLLLALIVLPILTSVLASFGQMPSQLNRTLMNVEIFQTWAMRLFIVAWIFFLGGCFASFLNVVAWRVPRGRSILGSSRCPYCNIELKFQDNLPVVGWLRSGGQCRTCMLPISARYLVAELILGSIFLILTLVILAGGGWTLPVRPVDRIAGFELVLYAPKWDLLQLLSYFLVLLASLFTFALVNFDRMRVPPRIWMVVIVLGLGLPLIWPAMQLVHWKPSPTYPTYDHVSLVFSKIMGAGSGLICWQLVSRLLRARVPVGAADADSQGSDGKSIADAVQLDFNSISLRNQSGLGFLAVGLYLGWQATISVTVIFVLLAWAWERRQCQRRPKNPASQITLKACGNGFVLIATLIHLLVWRIQSMLPFWL